MTDVNKLELTVEDAQAAINADKQRRSDECNQEIVRILNMYRCKLITPIQVAEDGRLFVSPLVVAL